VGPPREFGAGFNISFQIAPKLALSTVPMTAPSSAAARRKNSARNQ
jgi:hypothetical protein